MIRVTTIENIENGHKRIVHMQDTETGAAYSMTFGDSVTERWIRHKAPMLVSTKTKTKRGTKT